MAYNTNLIRGYADDGIFYRNEDPATLFEKVKNAIECHIQENNIPAIVTEDVLKSGGLFGSKLPLLLISHPDKSCKFFTLGIYVNGTQVFTPLFGYSAEIEKANSGSLFKKADQFKIQQEHEWRARILQVFDD